MGSLITALQNQNIAAANQETLGDVYAANPQNLGYTENPFGYTSSPAVVQTAYPQYGYNATAPQVPQSYEDYDLTTLFGMLQGMNTPGPDTSGYQPMVPAFYPTPDSDPISPPSGPDTSGYRSLPPAFYPTPDFDPISPPSRPVTPAGILAQLAGEVQLETGQPTPVPGAYTVPGAVTPPIAPSAEEQAEAEAAEDKRIRDMIAEDAKKRQREALEQQYQRTFAGIVSGPPGYTTKNLSNAEMIRLIENPELITGDE